MQSIEVALLGCGVVGQGVVKLLSDESSPLWERLGKKLVIKKVLVRDLKQSRDVTLAEGVLTTDPREILEDDAIKIVIEVMGGIEPAGALLLQALNNGKHIVTANKALLAEAGGPIFEMAAEKKRHVGFEASVAGGIPILKGLSEGLIANRIERVSGIINGTANYILSEMTEHGLEFADVLKAAQEAGYAEADPTFDIDGIDAAHKLAILITLCYGCQVPFKEIYTEGIRNISSLDIDFADSLGYSIKLLAIAQETKQGVEARVHPTMLPHGHLLTQVHGAMNAIHVVGDAVGESMFYGAGAGSLPTASAVVSDVAMIAARLEEPSLLDIAQRLHPADVRPISEWEGEYYLRFAVRDCPGALAQIAGLLGDHDISITSVYQPERDEGAEVPIVVMTHEAREQNMQSALQKIEALETVLAKPVLVRVEKG